MLSFLNQALFGNDNERDLDTSIENGRQQPAWRELTQFYQAHETILKKYELLDVSWAAKSNKDVDLEEAIEAFASSANLIAEGLVRLANVHPILGVAVSAYHSVLTILLPAAIGRKKVLLVMLQMQSIMCTMFQLRHIKYTIRTKAGAEKTPLQSLLIAIATDIVQCGHELNYFMNKDMPVQLLLVNIFEQKVRQQIKTLVTRRNELQSLLSDRSGLGITRSRTTTTIAAIGHVLQQADPRLHNFVARFFKKIRTQEESEAIELLEGTKSAPPNGKLDAFVEIYIGFFIRFMDNSGISGYTGSILRKVAYEALKNKLELDASSLTRFKKFIEILDQSSERKLLLRQKAIQRMTQQLHLNVDLPVVVRMSTLGGRTKSVDLGPFVNMEDVEMANFWTKMQFGTTVKIETFIASYHDYLTTQSTSSKSNVETLVPILSYPKWASKSIRLTDSKMFCGSLYEPGSGYISLDQAHKFALERPEGMSLASWIAYWSSGWRINITTYRDQIYSIIQKMHQASDNVHIANTAFVASYLNCPSIIYMDGLFEFIGATPQDNDPELAEVAKSIAKSQEERILANLTDVSFIIQSPREVEFIGGFERIETFFLPLLYILLQRHLAIIEIAQKIPLMDMEILVHIQSLHHIFKSFYKRMNELTVKFTDAQQDIESQFKTFAYGMFRSSFVLSPTGIRPDISNTLSTFRNATLPLSHSYTGFVRGKAAVDLSILIKGPGKGSQYNEIDRSIADRTRNQRTHELEGSWHANTPLAGIIQINIGPIIESSNNMIIEFEGNAESFMSAYKVTGRLQSSAPPSSGLGSSSSEKSEKPEKSEISEKANHTDYLDVYLKCERLIRHPDAPRPLVFKGRYDPNKEVFRGVWDKGESATVGEATSPGILELSYSHISAADSRFAYFLHEGGEGQGQSTAKARVGVDPSWTMARRRWAFAIEAVLSQVQVRMGSSKALKRGIEERRKWLQIAVFEETMITDGNVESDDSSADQRAFDVLESTVPAENGRLYQALTEYLHLRKAYDLGGISCDSCNIAIKRTRFACITCRSRFSKGHNIDLCVSCFESPKPMKHPNFVHLNSHSLIRTSRRINHFDDYEMICQARVLSEDIKRSFRAISDQENDTADQTALASLTCACCDKKVTLPCYSCLTCSLHPVFCLDCDRKGEGIRRDHPSFPIHTRKHLLLRISDSTSVDKDLSYET